MIKNARKHFTENKISIVLQNLFKRVREKLKFKSLCKKFKAVWEKKKLKLCERKIFCQMLCEEKLSESFR